MTSDLRLPGPCPGSLAPRSEGSPPLLARRSERSCWTCSAGPAPVRGSRPGNCCSAMLMRTSTPTITRARQHSRGLLTSPCSAPPSLGVGSMPPRSTVESSRRFHPATAVCFGEHMRCRQSCGVPFNHPRAVLFFVHLNSGERASVAAFQSLVEDELVESCQSFCASSRSPSTQCQDPPGHVLSQDFSHLQRTHLLVVHFWREVASVLPA